METNVLTVVIFMFGTLTTVLFALTKHTFQAHVEDDRETRKLVLQMMEDERDTPRALVLERIENLHATVIEMKKSVNRRQRGSDGD
jgi:hypothetical protein